MVWGELYSGSVFLKIIQGIVVAIESIHNSLRIYKPVPCIGVVEEGDLVFFFWLCISALKGPYLIYYWCCSKWHVTYIEPSQKSPTGEL